MSRRAWSRALQGVPLAGLAFFLVACDDKSTSPSGGEALGVTIAANVTSGRAPLEVNFTSNARGGTGAYSYSWSFGDGSGSSLKDPTKRFGSGGTYSVTLQVTSDRQKAVSAPMVIRVDSDIRVVCSAEPLDGQAPHTVDFKADASGSAGPFSYLWKFGDGGASTEPSPTYTYGDPGTYVARVTVTSGGGSGTCAETIKVYGDLAVTCTAHRLGPSTVKLGANPSFCFSDSPCNYSWDFGDGTGATGNTLYHVQHDYAAPGTYTATALVTTGRNAASCSIAFDAS